MKSKQAIRWALLLAAILLIVLWLRPWNISQSEPSDDALSTREIEPNPPPLGSNFDEYFQSIESGGVAQDGIPSIDYPDFVSVENAKTFMSDDDWVMISRMPEGLIIVPQEVLVWHEIINMPWDETENFVFSYCPLTATALGFKGEGYEFGTSGKLLNSNLVMYDRATNEYWPQMLARSITGMPPGIELNHHPIHWSTWRSILELGLEGKVLTTNTGFLREYGSDPYGSHELRSSYYFNDSILFPLMTETDKWFPKKTITGIVVDGKPFVLDPIELEKKSEIRFNWQEKSFLIFWDEGLNTTRIFDMSAFSDLLIEQETRTLFSPSQNLRWDYDGWPLEHESILSAPVYYDAFWFAWYAYFPETTILEVSDF